jgi:hypothetical protein
MSNMCVSRRGGSLIQATAVLIFGISMAAPAMANASYSAQAVYVDANHRRVEDIRLNESTPQLASAGYYANAATYANWGGTAIASAAFDPGAPTLLQKGAYGATSYALITYSLQLKGAPDVYVPVLVKGNVTAGAIHATDVQGQNYQLVDNPNHAGPDDGLAEPSNYFISSVASISIFQPTTGAGLDKLEVYSQLDGDDNFALNAGGQGSQISNLYFFKSNTDINVRLFAQATVGYDTHFGTSGSVQYGNVTASADPTFEIADPAYANFSIVGVPSGPGPGIPGAIPEPATWALLTIGFVGTAVAGRRGHVG